MIGRRIAFSNTWCNNCQSDKTITELDSTYFLNKKCFGLLIFEADFVLKIEDNLCMLALS